MKTIISLEGVDIIQKNYQQVVIRGDGKEEFNQFVNKEISMFPPSKNLEVITNTQPEKKILYVLALHLMKKVLINLKV